MENISYGLLFVFMLSNLSVLQKELMTTSGKSYLQHNYQELKCIKLTKPILDRTDVSPLIEDNIEDGHDANHGVERGQSSHRGESSIVVDNHEDEEDENSGHKIHQHLQHQDDHIEGVQSLIFILVAILNNELYIGQ